MNPPIGLLCNGEHARRMCMNTHASENLKRKHQKSWEKDADGMIAKARLLKMLLLVGIRGNQIMIHKINIHMHSMHVCYMAICDVRHWDLLVHSLLLMSLIHCKGRAKNWGLWRCYTICVDRGCLHTATSHKHAMFLSCEEGRVRAVTVALSTLSRVHHACKPCVYTICFLSHTKAFPLSRG